MAGSSMERTPENKQGKSYIAPEIIKYDSLKELTLCTCVQALKCACARGALPWAPTCPCPYSVIP